MVQGPPLVTASRVLLYLVIFMQICQIQQRKLLRSQMKAKRLNLSSVEQHNASYSLIPQALSLIESYQASHLAFYLPFNAEISPLPLMKALHKQGKSLYLPVLHPFSAGNLLFIKYEPQNVFQQHSFGMLQPALDVRLVKPIDELEMIFTPLLACDRKLNRLGYGGGFYDRTLSQTQAISVGLAYSCQLVDELPVAPWDKALDHLILGDTK